MTKYCSALNRQELVSDFEKHYKLTDDVKDRLMTVVDAMDALIVDYSNDACHTRNEYPLDDWGATVLYIHGKFYADLCVGSNEIELDCPTIADAANDLNIADKDGFDFDELMTEVEWSFTWGVK